MAKIKNKLGMSALISHPEKKSIDEQMRIFASVGFESFFLSCGVTNEFDKIPFWASCARECDILFEAVHAPSDLVDSVWLGAEQSVAYKSATERMISLCSDGGVEKLVLHTGNDPKLSPNERGLEFWRKLEDFAASRGVVLCYENANTPALFEAVVSSANAPHGICHDIGHQLCYTRSINYASLFGDKILYTHIHDNLADGRDLHLLPGDGINNWREYFDEISSLGYTGTLNLELSCYHRPDYCELSFEKFAAAAHDRLYNLIKE